MCNVEMKNCSKCKRELPMNTDYFFKKKDTKDGYTNRCKECQGYKFSNKLTKIPKEGYKFCIKCDRELKSTSSYFPVDRTCKDGLRNVCRECGKDGHFMKDDYVPKKWWTEEENELFKHRYPHYLNEELIEIFYSDETDKSLTDKAYKLGVVKSEETRDRRYLIHSEKMSDVMIGRIITEEARKKISESNKGRFVGEKSVWYGKKRSEDQRAYLSKIKRESGQWQGENNPRHKDPLNGERNGNWQGGLTPINAKIRNSHEYYEWKISVFRKDDYTCQCCGRKNKLEAHHIKNFSSHEDKRFDLNNGISLCEYCHNPIHKGSFHYEFGTRNNDLEELQEFFTGISWNIKTRKIHTYGSYLINSEIICKERRTS